MTKFHMIPLALTLLVLGCSSPAPTVNQSTLELQNPVPVTPTRLTASVGGFLGSSYRIELQEDGTLVYLKNPETFALLGPGTERETLRISEQQWALFRGALDEAQVWTWDQEYLDPNVFDGTTWHLKAAYQDRVVSSQGSNATPKSRQFKRLLKAVEELIGGREFR